MYIAVPNLQLKQYLIHCLRVAQEPKDSTAARSAKIKAAHAKKEGKTLQICSMILKATTLGTSTGTQ